MNEQEKINIELNRLLGEFIGTLEGILFWDIPEGLSEKLRAKIKELRRKENFKD